MGILVDGKWTDKWYEPDAKGRFVREPTRFHDNVSANPEAKFPAASGRYHLYVSYACPWAHRTLIVRALKGLDEAVGVSVVHPDMGSDGWSFDNAYPGATGDRIGGRKLLRERYLDADPNYTGRVTVPALWDRERATIVNNESRELIRILNDAFDDYAKHPEIDLFPDSLVDDIDAMIDANYEPVNNGVYKCGFATTQAAYEEAFDALFDQLDRCEEILSRQRYLCGDRLTAADICLFTTLVRFDPVYVCHFKCNKRRIYDYPNLWHYTKELYQLPGVAETVNLDHIKRHYYWSHDSVNPKRIIALGPEIDYATPHNRNKFAAAPLA